MLKILTRLSTNKLRDQQLRESSFNMTRGGGGLKILRGAPKIFRHPKGGSGNLYTLT